jgi:hypothetical protein
MGNPMPPTELEKNQRQALERVYSAFNETADEMESMLPYVPDYFREKWEYDKALAYAKLEVERLGNFLCITQESDLIDGGGSDLCSREGCYHQRRSHWPACNYHECECEQFDGEAGG